MELLTIWNAQNEWRLLSGLKKTPSIAYTLMKYGKKVEEELFVCEKQRVEILHEVTETGPNEVVSLATDSDKFPTYVEKFSDFLKTTSELKLVDLTMEQLVKAISVSDENKISENDLRKLEPFFKEPKEEPTKE